MTTYYLYVKTHNKTGLKYLGRTKRSDPHKYYGSGQEWLQHLREHGFDYSTKIILQTESYEELADTGIKLSNEWNIVESTDWANKIIDNGGGSGSERSDLPFDVYQSVMKERYERRLPKEQKIQNLKIQIQEIQIKLLILGVPLTEPIHPIT